jgi:hypothetical protein
MTPFIGNFTISRGLLKEDQIEIINRMSSEGNAKIGKESTRETDRVERIPILGHLRLAKNAAGFKGS